MVDSRSGRGCTAQNRTVGGAWAGEYELVAPSAYRFLRWNFTKGVGGNGNG